MKEAIDIVALFDLRTTGRRNSSLLSLLAPPGGIPLRQVRVLGPDSHIGWRLVDNAALLKLLFPSFSPVD